MRLEDNITGRGRRGTVAATRWAGKLKVMPVFKSGQIVYDRVVGLLMAVVVVVVVMAAITVSTEEFLLKSPLLGSNSRIGFGSDEQLVAF